MNNITYISFASMGRTIGLNLYKVPQDVDLIVGVSQSGLLAGNLLALSLNIPVIDIDGYIYDRKPRHGFSRKTKNPISYPHEARHVLIVEDSVGLGNSLALVKKRIAEASIDQNTTYCSVYAESHNADKVDIYLELLSSPALFEWGIMKSPVLEDACIDIDGVLCLDPTRVENDDDSVYVNFLRNAKPLALPSYNIGYLVTNRLEKYRPETEAWLNKHNIQYKQLHMLDLPDAETRRRLNIYTAYKAYVYYKYSNSPLFIESNQKQALAIAKLSGKQTLCYADKKLYTPEKNMPDIVKTGLSEVSTVQKARNIALKLFRRRTKAKFKKTIVKSYMLHKDQSEKQPLKEMYCQD